MYLHGFYGINRIVGINRAVKGKKAPPPPKKKKKRKKKKNSLLKKEEEENKRNRMSKNGIRPINTYFNCISGAPYYIHKFHREISAEIYQDPVVQN